jgi:hypothetical protein
MCADGMRMKDMRTVIKALLAASALLPVGAQAQNADWHGRGDRGEARAPRGTYSGGADMQAQLQAPVQQATPDRRGRRGDANRQRNSARADQAQADRGEPYQGRSDQGRSDARGIYQGQAYQRQPDGSRDPYRGRGDAQPVAVTRSYDNGAGAVRRYQDDRRGVNQGNRGYGQTYGNRYEGRGGVWNRDWRRDDRYDYNGYRSYNQGAYRLPRYYAPSGWTSGYRRFGIGAVISSFLWNRDYWIDDPYAYRLPEAYGPYRWVRYYDDALLIDIRTGAVVDSVYGIFY